MKLEIKKQVETPLLSRSRVTLLAEYQGATPPRADIRKDVAKKVGVGEDLTIIKHIYTRFGKQKSKIIAHVYKNKEDLAKFEHEYLIEKHKEKKAAEEAQPEAKEEPKEEKKAEEKPKEEKKEEEPKEEPPKVEAKKTEEEKK